MNPNDLWLCSCRHDGRPVAGRCVSTLDGAAWCLPVEGEPFPVRRPDGTMPADVTDLNLTAVPAVIADDPTVTLDDLTPAPVRRRMGEVNLILEECRAGVIDRREAAARLHRLLGGL